MIWPLIMVRKISPQGVVSTLAGYSPDSRFNRLAEQNTFSSPSSIALDQQGNPYVADAGNAVLRRVSPTGVSNKQSTYGSQHHKQGFANGPAAQAEFNTPVDVAIGPDGALYVAESHSHTVRKISPQGVVSTLAGQPDQLSN